MVLKKLWICILLLVGIKSYGQVYYSTNPLYLKNKTEQNNILSNYKYAYPDTSISELSNYFPRNFMGNMGLASPNYVLKYGTNNLGFNLLASPLENDKFHESQVTYYRTKGPYATLNGIAGSKEFQIFKMLFTHTYKEKVNITIGFNRYTSKGYYLRQQTYTNNFYLTSNYTTTNKRMGYYLFLLNNGNRNTENGGIKDGILTDSSMLLNKNLFKVNLALASRNNNEFKAAINPWFRLNRTNDSIGHTDHYLQFKSSFSTNSYRYTDTSRIFYSNMYLDSVKTNDSTHTRKYINELSYSLMSKNEKFGFSFGYKNELNQLWQFGDSLFMNQGIQSDLTYRTRLGKNDSTDKKIKTLELCFNGQYIFEGTNAGDYKVENYSTLFINEKKQNKLFLNILVENRRPDYIYNTWKSNHFYWLNNGFKSQQQLQVKLGMSAGRYFTVFVFNQSISNYLYFDKDALASQNKGTVNNTGIHLNFSKVFFKHLGIGIDHIYQSTSNASIVRIPQHISTMKLFYSGNLAKNNLQLQIGTQLQTYASFYGYNYMPSTQVFYVQDKYKTDTYPYIDIYINARIRPVSFFLKMENALQGLVGPNYSFVPGYYQTDRAFRFGISWVFFD